MLPNGHLRFLPGASANLVRCARCAAPARLQRLRRRSLCQTCTVEVARWS